MRLASFNVNGLRSMLSKNKQGDKIKEGCNATHEQNIRCENVIQSLLKEDFDIICLQEIKCNNCQVDLEFVEKMGYNVILNPAARLGYSGTAIFTKVKPLSVRTDFHNDNEGRVIIAEYAKFVLINLYVPNSKPDLSRLDFRVNEWDTNIRQLVNELTKTGKEVILCGDFNVANENIDVHNPKSANGSHGFTKEERESFDKLLNDCNLIDTFRHLHPKTAKYSWFSPFANSRKNNKGWRIDYFLVSDKLKNKIKKADIFSEYYGSDHLVIFLEISI